MTTEPADIPAYYGEKLAAAPAVVREYYTALNAGDGAALQRIIANDFQLISPLGMIEGAETYAAMIGGFGGWIEPTEVMVDGNRVALFFTFHMTAPAQASVRTCDMLEIADGKIAVNHHYANALDFPPMG